MSQKASRIPTSLDRLQENQIDTKKLFALNRHRNVPVQIASQAGSSGGAASTPGTAEFLEKAGDSMIGPIAFFQRNTTVDVSDASIDVGPDSGTFTSYITVAHGGDDDLDTIFNASFTGQKLYLQNVGVGELRINQGSVANGGNIITPDGTDFVMAPPNTTFGQQIVNLIFDPTASTDAGVQGAWRIIDSRPLRDVIHASATVDQLANFAVGDHLEFNSVVDLVQSGITVSTGVGQAQGIFSNLIGGRSYVLNSEIRMGFANNAGDAIISWFDLTAGVFIGTVARNYANPGTQRENVQPQAIAVFSPLVDSQVELRIVASAVVTDVFFASDAGASRGATYALITEAFGTGTAATSGGGGGITFPILYPKNNLGTIGFISQTIDMSASDSHVTEFTANGDVEITFINVPADTFNHTGEIIMIQDATGGHALTFSQSINQPVVIDTTPNARNIISFQSNEGGTSFDVFTATSAGGGGGGGGDFLQRNLSNMLSPTVPPVDLDMNSHTIRGVIDLDFDGAGSEIGGLVTLKFRTADPDRQINTVFPDFLRYNIESVGGASRGHLFSVGAIAGAAVIAQFRQDPSGVNELNMSSNQIRSVKDIRFNGIFDEDIPVNVAGIGYDITSNFLRYNTLTAGAHVFSLAGVTEFLIGENIITAFNKRIENVTDPLAPQDVATKNYVDTAGAGANTELSNLTTTAINADLTPDLIGGFNLGTVSTAWINAFIDRLRFINTTGASIGEFAINRVAANTFFGGSPESLVLNTTAGGGIIFTANGSPQVIIDINDVDLRENNLINFPFMDMESDTTNTAFLSFRDTGLSDGQSIDVRTYNGRNSINAEVTYASVDVGATETTSGSQVGFHKIQTTAFGLLGGTELEQTFANWNFKNFDAGTGMDINFRQVMFPLPAGIDLVRKHYIANDTSVTERDFAVEIYEIFDDTAGSIDGTYRVRLPVANVLRTFFRLNDAGNGLIDIERDIDMNNNKLDEVREITINDLSAVRQGLIRGVSGLGIEFRLEDTADYVLTDAGGVVYQYNNTLFTHTFSGTVLRSQCDFFDQLQVLANPSTPAPGFARTFIFDDGAGNQELRIRFDNGTVKTIATDV